MCASRRSAVWPQVVAVALMGLGVAGCTRFRPLLRRFDSERSARRRHRLDSAAPATALRASRCRVLPAMDVSGGGRGMGSYQPGSGDVTGSLPPPAPPPPRLDLGGRHADHGGPGETLETISRRYGVPVAAIMEANNITQSQRRCIQASIW